MCDQCEHKSVEHGFDLAFVLTKIVLRLVYG